MTNRERLKRLPSKGMISGVCAGIADYFEWGRSATRILYVLFSIFSAAFPGLLVYIILWIVLPKR